MKHPYTILTENISKYSKLLKPSDIVQTQPNVFAVDDADFDIITFLQDVQKETGVVPLEHTYIGAACEDKYNCFKPYVVYGFDNVLFYFKNKERY